MLIDSATLEAGGDVDNSFRDTHAAEIEAFRREQATRDPGGAISDADILREVMNTVGKKGYNVSSAAFAGFQMGGVIRREASERKPWAELCLEAA